MPKIIHAISGPRNISTALMYSFAQRPGCAVIDEPMYGVYLKELDPDHPGKEETLTQWPTSVEGVKDWVRSFDHCQELYLKNMAHHMDGQPWHWVEPSAYLFWIRHPRKVVQSFTKVIDTIVPKDIGLLEEWDQFQQLQHGNVPVVVVDSDEMLSNPARNMAILCQALGLPPREEMMNWPPERKNTTDLGGHIGMRTSTKAKDLVRPRPCLNRFEKITKPSSRRHYRRTRHFITIDYNSKLCYNSSIQEIRTSKFG